MMHKNLVHLIDGVFVKTRQDLNGITKLLLLQLLVSLLMSVGIFISLGKQPALSSLFGGLTALLPSWIFAKKLFQYQGARAAKHIVKSFYLGEFLKILSTIIMFMWVFLLYEDIHPLLFFITYVTVLMLHWFAPLVVNHKQKWVKK